MPLYEYECVKGQRFEAIQKITEKPLKKCSVCSSGARRAISQPTLVHNRGVHVFDRVTKDDALRNRPSSLKSFKKDKFQSPAPGLALHLHGSERQPVFSIRRLQAPPL